MIDQQTLKPRTIFCNDNLSILRGINSDSVDLIYLDPPFNKGRAFHAPIDTSAEGAEFTDIWVSDSVKDEWHNQIIDNHPQLYTYLDATGLVGSRSAKYYLIYMAVRLMEMHRILKDSGSIYLHCDPTASHYLKLLMDTIFGHQSFKNEVVWHYGGGGASKMYWGRKHDILLYYTKGKEWIFNVDAVREAYKWDAGQKRADGSERDYAKGKIPDDVFYLSGVMPWAKESTGYPTQKPLPLLKRIVEASSSKGDFILDPFCGCATTCIAAECLQRQWVGIDVSAKAFDLVKMRLNREVPPDLFTGEPVFRRDIPTRTDIAHKRTPAKEDKHHLYEKQSGLCKGCATQFATQHLEIDHIIPKSDGGGNEIENLQLLCGNCNRIKGNRPMEYLIARLKQEYGAREF